MPKDLNNTTTSTIASKLAGGKKHAASIKSGKDLFDEESPVNILLFGDQGTGKTFVIVSLLLLGFRVVVLNTDFGKSGIKTVKNYFKDHPEQAHLMYENLRIVETDLHGFMDFCRDPKSLVDDIYTWNPDWIFWDGATAFQQGDLESLVCGGDFLHESTDWQDWGKVRKGTVFPLMNLLSQHNTENGKLWHKVVTTLEQEKVEKRKSASQAEKKKGDDIIPGSEKKGPMLDTSARDLAGAGFDLVLQTIKRTLGSKESFKYKTVGNDLMVKQRGYGLPAEVDANFEEVFRKYIAPKIGWRESNAVGEKA